MNQPARYEVIAWDGCGRWSDRESRSRSDAREEKIGFNDIVNYYATVVTNYGREFTFEGPKTWAVIKIWDRKNKKFIT